MDPDTISIDFERLTVTFDGILTVEIADMLDEDGDDVDDIEHATTISVKIPSDSEADYMHIELDIFREERAQTRH